MSFIRNNLSNSKEVTGSSGTSPHSVRASVPTQLERLLTHHQLLREQKLVVEEELTALYNALDPAHLVRSLPGVGVTLAPFLLALWPAICAVRSRQALKAYVGWDPATVQSSRTIRPHGHLTKSGPSWARWALYLAAGGSLGSPAGRGLPSRDDGKGQMPSASRD